MGLTINLGQFLEVRWGDWYCQVTWFGWVCDV